MLVIERTAGRLLRKSFDTLEGVVRNSLRLDPLSGHLFVFSNARKNRLKILFCDKTGWWVCAKRLEVGTLAWPASPILSMELSSEKLTLRDRSMDFVGYGLGFLETALES